MGAVMVLTALAILVDADLRFQTAIADDLPAALVNPTGALERSDAVEQELAELRGTLALRAGRRRAAASSARRRSSRASRAGSTRRRSRSPSLRGKVVLIDFWTYTCINCIRTLPYLRAWDERYRDRGLVIVGVHTPEFEFEKDAGNVRDAIARSGLRYPVAQDNDYGTWNAWGNQYWPAKYLIDADGPGPLRALRRGRVRRPPSRRSASCSRRPADPGRPRRPPARRGARRGDARDLPRHRARRALADAAPRRRARVPGAARRMLPDRFALEGRWSVDDESAEAVARAVLKARVRAKSVYLVLGSRRPARSTVVWMASRADRDRRRQRLYKLVKRPRAGSTAWR